MFLAYFTNKYKIDDHTLGVFYYVLFKKMTCAFEQGNVCSKSLSQSPETFRGDFSIREFP